MASELASQLRHPKERLYGGLMVAIGAVVWAALIIAAVYAVANGQAAFLLLLVFYGLLFWLAGIIASAFYRAYAFGHQVLISEGQLPQLHHVLVDCSGEIGLRKLPAAFVYNSNGVINAFARRMLGKPYVFLTSSLIDADTDAQVRFVIGHELGHHAAGHLDWRKNLLKLPAHLVPFLPQAYSRGRELTADRIGAYLAHDIDASRGALQMLACGSSRLNPMLDHAAFAAQEAMVPGIFGWLLKIVSYYPRTTLRVLSLGDELPRRRQGPRPGSLPDHAPA